MIMDDCEGRIKKEENDEEFMEEVMPDIYKFQFMPSEIQTKFADILNDSSVNEVYDTMCQYIGDNIEPIGWKAIWKVTSMTINNNNSSKNFPKDFSFRVNVVDVDYRSLEASVVIMELIHPKLECVSTKEDESVRRIMEQNDVVTVPLVDLYVIIATGGDDESFYETAYLIELLRIFFKTIWRPWDGLEDSSKGENFVSTRLATRVTLISEMKNGILSKGFINRINAILTEAFEIKDRMEVLAKKNVNRNRMDEEMKMTLENQLDDYVADFDAAEYLRLQMKLLDLEREMKIIEDGQLRSMYYTLIPELILHHSEEDMDDGGEELEKNKYKKSIHLVTKLCDISSLTFYLNKLNELQSMETDCEKHWNVEVHNSLRKAIGVAHSGDIIYLSSGTYTEPLPWIEKEIEIIGIEENVILQSHQDCGNIFLFINSSTSTVKLTNLIIRVECEVAHLIVVKTGRLLLNNCCMDCNNKILLKPIITIPDHAIEMKHNTCLLNVPDVD